MKIVPASYELTIPETYEAMLNRIEDIARTCYKSEGNKKEGSAEKLVRALIKSHHEAMIEHAFFTVKFIVSRAVSHEIVRHRLASFAQESQRYCNFSKEQFGSEITFIKPLFFDEGTPSFDIWKESCLKAEDAYFKLLDFGCAPEEAREVLPNSTKTEINVTMNIREWRHFFNLRALDKTGKAHPSMKEVTVPLLKEVKEKLPVFFEDM